LSDRRFTEPHNLANLGIGLPTVFLKLLNDELGHFIQMGLAGSSHAGHASSITAQTGFLP
jgi:hypothetical protein